MNRNRLFMPIAIAVLGLSAACSRQPAPDAAPAVDAAKAGQADADAQASEYPTRAWFGDQHVHTGWSADAGLDGAITTPEEAFRFARGDMVKSNTGLDAKLKRAHDWMVITDHSDGMGVINEILAGNPEMMADPVVKGYHDDLTSGDPERIHPAMLDVIDRQSKGILPAVTMDPKWMQTVWEKTITIADKYNDPGKFTAFIGYEWTVNADNGNNLHRNIVYRDNAEKARQMLPLTTFVSALPGHVGNDPESLWAWLEQYEKKTGGKLLAIPHNGNLSNGRMFEEQRFDGSPLTAEYIATRQRWERLFELVQVKGQSESHPSLSPTDEFADWELWDSSNLNGVPKKPGMIRTEYWREAQKSGLRLEASLGANPFKVGAASGTDTHTGLSSVEEDNFFGKYKTFEPSKDRWQPVVIGTGPNAKRGADQTAGGLTGVWATANTRESLWDAMMRKETFSTSGTRMTVRLFGGYDFAEGDLGDLVKAGYGKGVPMGGDLAGAPAGKAPGFLIAAMKDPEGANLDRVQVIKGWVDADGEAHERIWDVKWAGERKLGADGKLPPVGNTVDLKTATYRNTIGAGELIAYWQDPQFDPAQRAFYYVRALEIPTPRWTAYDVVRFKSQMPASVRMIGQERAFSSPIWYAP